MNSEQERTRYEQQLTRMGPEAKALAEWGAGALLQALLGWLRALDVDPIAATSAALRVSRATVTHLYSEVKAYRKLKAMNVRSLTALLLALLAPAIAAAQTQATRSHRLGWTYSATTIAEAQAPEYFLLDNGTRTTQPMLPIACTGTAAPFACSTPFPQLTPGPHTLHLVARQRINGVTEESPPSAPLAIVMVIVVSPTNLVVLPPPPQQ